jgi:hypothetical protein
VHDPGVGGTARAVCAHRFVASPLEGTQAYTDAFGVAVLDAYMVCDDGEFVRNDQADCLDTLQGNGPAMPACPSCWDLAGLNSVLAFARAR